MTEVVVRYPSLIFTSKGQFIDALAGEIRPEPW